MREVDKEKIYTHIEAFRKNLKLERQSRKLTQREVADLLGIKTQSYQAYESGVAMPTMENLIKIVYIFELSIDEMLEL